jgi:chemotaxis protein MotB
LITLLLGLFIILYAVSNVDATKYESMMENISDYFGNENFTEAAVMVDLLDLSDNKYSLKSSLQNFIEEYNFSNNIRLIENDRGIIISIMDNIMFSSGQAVLSEQSKPVLNKMTQLLKTIPNDIRIEGHTDNVPINTEDFPSNWHLSIARATNTAYYLMNNLGLDQERVSVVGNSEFKPISDNDSPETRALNRRVDIVILNK